jgi:Fe-S cluster assembly iron-binding protein IscA
MLTLTPTATDAVRQIVAQGPVDDDTGGLRIAAGQPTPEGVPLELSLVNGPEAEDQEIGAADAHVYLEPRVAEVLDDKVLDAQLQEDGVGFSIREPDADAT